MTQALLILKPDVFDPSMRLHPDDTLKKSISLPDYGGLLYELLNNSGVDIMRNREMKWTEGDIKNLYNQPHHLLPESRYKISRVDRLVEIFAGKRIKVFELSGNDNFIDTLRLKMKGIRAKYLKSPNIAFVVSSIFQTPKSLENEK